MRLRPEGDERESQSHDDSGDVSNCPDYPYGVIHPNAVDLAVSYRYPNLRVPYANAHIHGPLSYRYGYPCACPDGDRF